MSVTPNLIADRDTECRVMALLQCTHAMIMETDRLASLIAELIGVEPSDGEEGLLSDRAAAGPEGLDLRA